VADSAIPIILFLGFLFVSLSLILGLGIVSREEERAEERLSEGSPSDGREVGSSFLRMPDPAAEHRPAGVNRIARHVASAPDDAVRSAPAQRTTGPAASVDDLVAQLEGFLRDEAAAVAAFVSAPSIDGLFDDGKQGRN